MLTGIGRNTIALRVEKSLAVDYVDISPAFEHFRDNLFAGKSRSSAAGEYRDDISAFLLVMLECFVKTDTTVVVGETAHHEEGSFAGFVFSHPDPFEQVDEAFTVSGCVNVWVKGDLVQMASRITIASLATALFMW